MKSRMGIIVLWMVVTFALSPSLNAKVTEIDLDSFKTQVYNDVIKDMNDVEMRITYTLEDKSIAIYTDDGIGHSVINLTQGQRDKLNSMLSKFREWGKLASAKNVTLDKKIGSLQSGHCFYNEGDDFISGNSISIETKFMTVTNPERAYYLILNFGTITDSNNEYRTHRPSSQYLDVAGVDRLSAAISQTRISSALMKYKMDKSVSDQFK